MACVARLLRRKTIQAPRQFVYLRAQSTDFLIGSVGGVTEHPAFTRKRSRPANAGHHAPPKMVRVGE